MFNKNLIKIEDKLIWEIFNTPTKYEYKLLVTYNLLFKLTYEIHSWFQKMKLSEIIYTRILKEDFDTTTNDMYSRFLLFPTKDHAMIFLLDFSCENI